MRYFFHRVTVRYMHKKCDRHGKFNMKIFQKELECITEKFIKNHDVYTPTSTNSVESL